MRLITNDLLVRTPEPTCPESPGMSILWTESRAGHLPKALGMEGLASIRLPHSELAWPEAAFDGSHHGGSQN